jgi:hypothetical protein
VNGPGRREEHGVFSKSISERVGKAAALLRRPAHPEMTFGNRSQEGKADARRLTQLLLECRKVRASSRRLLRVPRG